LEVATAGANAIAKMSNNGEDNLKIGANKPAIPPSNAVSAASAAARDVFPKRLPHRRAVKRRDCTTRSASTCPACKAPSGMLIT
jgi:hypothetical protein